MADIQTISVVVAATSVVVAAIATMIQSRRAEGMRRTEVKTRQASLFMQLYEHWSRMEFIQDLNEIMDKWEWKDFDDFEKKGYFEPSQWAKFNSLAGFIEGLAVIVRMELIDINSLVSMEMWSYYIMGFWQKVEQFYRETRERWNVPTMGAWLEWLANELKKREQQLGKVW